MIETVRVTIRIDKVLRERIEVYGAEHGLSVSEVARLALLSQLERQPRGKTREGVEKKVGNPGIGDLAVQAANVRWGKPES